MISTTEPVMNQQPFRTIRSLPDFSTVFFIREPHSFSPYTKSRKQEAKARIRQYWWFQNKHPYRRFKAQFQILDSSSVDDPRTCHSADDLNPFLIRKVFDDDNPQHFLSINFDICIEFRGERHKRIKTYYLVGLCVFEIRPLEFRNEFSRHNLHKWAWEFNFLKTLLLCLRERNKMGVGESRPNTDDKSFEAGSVHTDCSELNVVSSRLSFWCVCSACSVSSYSAT